MKPRLVGFGHSYIGGFPAAPGGWLSLAGARLDLPVANHGRGGRQSPAIAATVARTTVYRTDTVVVQASLNDVGYRGMIALPQYCVCLACMLAILRARRPRRLLVLADPPISDWPAYPQNRGSDRVLRHFTRATMTIARMFRVPGIDLGEGWDAGRLMDADGVHPNSQGAHHIARRVALRLDSGG